MADVVDMVRLLAKRQSSATTGGPSDNDPMEARVAALEKALATLPTKSDIDGLKADLRSDIAAVRADAADSRADVHKAIADNHRWTHTALMGMAGLFVVGLIGLLFTIWSANKPQAAALQQPAQAPIIINVPASPTVGAPPAALGK